jgi:hypothetical protein
VICLQNQALHYFYFKLAAADASSPSKTAAALDGFDIILICRYDPKLFVN